ncbi:MAG: DUF6114 domain-containing protein [Actinoplanes sp.]
MFLDVAYWDRFRQWRRHRPFWGGLFLVLAALELFFSANLNLNGIEVHLGPQGFLSYLLPVLLLACGVLCWFSPAQRLFYGVIALVTALYTFVGLNLGGFILGMVLGIVGGALVIAWGPPRVAPPPEEPHESRSWFDGNPRTLVALFVALAVTASVLVVGGRTPASAAECPDGLPSRSGVAPSTAPPPTKARPPVREPPRPSKPPPAAPPPPASDPDPGTGNPILDGIGDFFEGIGDLLGIGSRRALLAPTPTPSLSPSPSSPSIPRPRVSGPEVPCLGARVFGLKASADDIPVVSARPGVMEVKSLTMYNSTYDGVVDMPTKTGSFKALKFSMDKAVNKPFVLTMDEVGKAQTVIRSSELTTEGAVRFYTPEFRGKLFGVIPVTFTPEQPPPLTLPVLTFTDVTIHLAYVRCDVLTADAMRLTEEL